LPFFPGAKLVLFVVFILKMTFFFFFTDSLFQLIVNGLFFIVFWHCKFVSYTLKVVEFNGNIPLPFDFCANSFSWCNHCGKFPLAIQPSECTKGQTVIIL
jgi:hypothetical protein